MDINDAGEIVGSYTDTSYRTHGFTYQSGVFTTVDVPGADDTSILGVNNRGDLVGGYELGSPEPIAFIYSHGAFMRLDVPDESSTVAIAINGHDEIVGSYNSGLGSFAASPIYGGHGGTAIGVTTANRK